MTDKLPKIRDEEREGKVSVLMNYFILKSPNTSSSATCLPCLAPW